MTQRPAKTGHGWELKAIFAFGVTFMALLLLIAVTFPQPNDFQKTIFRVLLALAAAGIAALIPGYLTIRFRNFVRAGGALSVFVIVYFFNPASYIVDDSPHPTDLFSIHIALEHDGGLVVNSYRFPISDIRKKQSGTEFLELLAQLPNISTKNLASSTVYRTSDEKIIDASTPSVLENRNFGVLVIPISEIKRYGDQHLAFTHIYNQVRQRE